MLYNMVAQHLGKELLVLTDREAGPGYLVERQQPLHGWWSKLELFAPHFRAFRPCLFFDLDTFILDDSRDLLELEGFYLIKDFYRPQRSNSGVMIIPEDTDEIWEKAQKWPHFNNPKMGDGDFLTTMPHKTFDDPTIVSYKVHCQKRPTGRIVCFHGKPKPHEAEGWAKKVWTQ